MSGILSAASAGVAFGLFQAINARAVRKVGDPYVSTFVQLLVAAMVLVGIAGASGELGRIHELDWAAVAYFVAAGVLHFLLGWTLLNISQQRIGASRSSPLLATVPLWGIAVAAVVRSELPAPAALAGIVVIVAGALTVSSPAAMAGMRWQDGRFALGTAFLWALSPIFTVAGLERVDSALLGVTIGVVASAACFGLALVLWPGGQRTGPPRDALALKALAGAVVALATWGRWAALDVTPVGVVLALNLLSVPVVLLVAPLVADRSAEHVTTRVWVGATLVVAGSLLLIVLG